MTTTCYYGYLLSSTDAMKLCNTKTIKSSHHFRRLVKDAHYPDWLPDFRRGNPLTNRDSERKRGHHDCPIDRASEKINEFKHIICKKVYLDFEIKYVIACRVKTVAFNYGGILQASTGKARRRFHKFINHYGLTTSPKLFIVSKR